jgi:RimJ/RimL family protein N-acetyltransferase
LTTVLRPATDSDLDAILGWRNQAPNREVSINSHQITRDEHAAWWARTTADPSRQVLIYERGGVSRGVVSFFDLGLSVERPTGAWGFFLDAEGLADTGQTLPAWLEVMREATAYAFDELGLDELRGEVLEQSIAVRQMNRRFRFTEGEPEIRVSDGREIVVYPISLRREDRRTPATQGGSA